MSLGICFTDLHAPINYIYIYIYIYMQNTKKCMKLPTKVLTNGSSG